MANGSDTIAARGERAENFEKFLRDQREGLLNFLRRRVASDEDAQDAAQESYIRLLRYSETEPASAWKPLLYRIATNVARDQARLAVTHRDAEHVSLDEEDEELFSPEPSQEQIVSQQQELELIQAAILELPRKCRQVYLLHRMQGMTYVAIAKHCGISQKTVEKHIAKALAALREKVGRST